jgi:fructose-bisphosphate aldolase, class II
LESSHSAGRDAVHRRWVDAPVVAISTSKTSANEAELSTGNDMALISLRQMLDHAAEYGYGVPAFNVNNLEQVQAIMQAAHECDSPVIMQASAGARKYAGEAFLRHLVEAAIETYPDVPLVMHQDHGASPAVCQAAINSGFSSVMMDGSLMPDMKTVAAYDYNVDVTRTVVEVAHAVGVSVEGELGCLGSLESGTAGDEDGSGAEGVLSHDMLLTDPEQAVDFVQRTGVDALAIAIGTSHGAYKFSRKPTGDILAIERIREIHRRLPATHLVMHGSSSVPQEWLDIIREFGGDIRETYGVPVEEICEGIRHGVRKINIDTDIRLTMMGAVRRSLAQHPSEFDVRRCLAEARVAARDLCRQRFEAFGSAGQAQRIKPVPLPAMAERYARSHRVEAAG